jgi:hypothetical protein
MNITSAKYNKSERSNKNCSVQIVIDSDEISVPLDPNNRHYAEILKQVKEGTLTIKDAD